MRNHTVSTTSLARFLDEVKRHPLLTREQELTFARRLRETGDQRFATRLVEANLRFVVKIAYQYRGYGLELGDLVQEGAAGLVVAVRKFDPDRGFRLISYAVWWIRAFIKSFIIVNYSMVKVGTTQGQRRLFYRLRSERERAERAGESTSDEALAARMHVRPSDVQTVERRLQGRDVSLDAPLGDDPAWTRSGSLPASEAGVEEALAREELRVQVRQLIRETVPELGPKHLHVLVHRILADEPQPLSALGEKFHVSRERMRQIEASTLERLRSRLGPDARVAA